MTLFTLRLELENVNTKILELITERKKLASEIQEMKNEQGLEAFVPKRELDLFDSMKEALEKLTYKEMMAFSLLMEDHAGSTYPAWSEGIQYGSKGSGPGINPLLLLLFHPDKIKVETLKPEYQKLAKLVEERR